MIALNNIIARAKSLHVRYLIEKGILLLILPFVHSLSTRLRLQALWIIGNLGTFDGQEGFKSAVLASDAVATMVQVSSPVSFLRFCFLSSLSGKRDNFRFCFFFTFCVALPPSFRRATLPSTS